MKKILVGAIVGLMTVAAMAITVYYPPSSGLPDMTGNSGKLLGTDGSQSIWQTIAVGGNMISTNNLSDVASIAGARQNLGVGATQNVTFATVNATAGIFTTVSANNYIGLPVTGITTANADLRYLNITGTANVALTANAVTFGLFTTANADARYVSLNQVSAGTLTVNELVVTGGFTLGGSRKTAWPASGGGTVTQSVQFAINGAITAIATTNILRDYGRTAFTNTIGASTLKTFSVIAMKIDSGATQPSLNILVNGSQVGSVKPVTAATWAINTQFTSAVLNANDTVEFGTGSEGSNDDASDVTFRFTFTQP